MATFDTTAAKSAGYSDAEINLFMAQQNQNNQASSHLTPQGLQPYFPNDPTQEMGAGSRLLAGAGRGMVHTARSIGNLVGVVPDSTMAEERHLDAPLLATRAGETGNIGGEAAITTPFTMGAASGIGQLGRIGAGIAANPLTNAALQGGVQGLITSDPGERTKNAGLGVVTGGTLAGMGGLVGKLARGLSKTPEAETLLREGVSLTPGQLNPGGAMNQFEQAAEGIPGVKQIIHGARDNAEQQYQAAIIGKAAAPGAKVTPSENIHTMLQQAYDSYAPLYDQAKGFPVKPAIVNAGADVPLTDALATAAKAPGAPTSLKKSANEWLQDQLTKLGPNPQSDHLIDLRSNIRARARQMNLSTDINAKDAAGIYERAANAVTSSLRSQLPKDALTALDTADSNYGVYKIVENAVAKSKDNIAGLTPQKLSQSIYESIQDPQYARGAGGQLRDLAKAGTSIFQTVVPPNGARVATLGAALGGAMTAPHVAAPVAAGMLGLTGTQTGRRLAAGMTAPQQAVQQLAGALGKKVPTYLQAPARALLARGGVAAGTPLAPGALTAASTLAAALMPGQKPQ